VEDSGSTGNSIPIASFFFDEIILDVHVGTDNDPDNWVMQLRLMFANARKIVRTQKKKYMDR
jgi:hypothetical protein